MNRLAMLLVTAAVVGTGGYFTVSQTTRTTAGITFSNVLFKAKDGRVVKSTIVPKATWRGGQTWVITIQHPAPAVPETLIVRAPDMKKYVYTDSVFAPFPNCVPYRVTVKPDTVLTATGRVSTRKDSLTAKLSLCRPYTVAEAAIVDSFPSEHWRITFCGDWQHRMSLAALDTLLVERLAENPDTAAQRRAQQEIAGAKLMPDSSPMPMRTWGKQDTAYAVVGHQYPVGLLARNRYTTDVRTMSSPRLWRQAAAGTAPDFQSLTDSLGADCEKERLSYQTWVRDSASRVVR